MRNRVSVRRSNPNWVREIVRRAEGLAGKEVAAGYPRGSEKASSTYDNGASVLDVAVWNQFGTSRIPARPFIDNAVTRIEEDKAGDGAEIARAVIHGKLSASKALKQIGQFAEKAIREAITDDVYEPNKTQTINASVKSKKAYKRASKKRKAQFLADAHNGGKKPLIDTGKLRWSVTSVDRDRSD